MAQSPRHVVVGQEFGEQYPQANGHQQHELPLDHRATGPAEQRPDQRGPQDLKQPVLRDQTDHILPLHQRHQDQVNLPWPLLYDHQFMVTGSLLQSPITKAGLVSLAGIIGSQLLNTQ